MPKSYTLEVVSVRLIGLLAIAFCVGAIIAGGVWAGGLVG